MDIFLDNTGLHAAGECLEGRLRGEADARGLLQLGTLLVFAERLQINGFELDTVGRRTKEIRDNLVHLGLDSSALVIGNQSETSYGSACRAAADAAAEELPSLVPFLQVPGGSTTPTGLPDGALAQEQNDMLKLLSGPRHIVLRQFEHTALGWRARGAVVFMLAVSPELRRAVGDYFQQAGGATPLLLEQLGIFLRLYLNDTLAAKSASFYAPATSRAEMIRRDTASLLNGIEGIVEDSAGALKPRTIGLPAVAAVLVNRSRGDPAAVITEALQLRNRATAMRKHLSLLADRLALGGPVERFEAERELTDARRAVQEDLGLADAPRLLDAIELQLMFGAIPFMRVKPAVVVDWINSRVKRKRYAVLTELSKAAAFASREDKHWAKLLTTSHRRDVV